MADRWRLAAMVWLTVLVILPCGATVLSGAGQRAAPGGREDTRGVEPFLRRLRAAVDSGDRRAVAALVRYPATLLASGFNIPLKDPAEVVRLYHLAFTPEMRCAIVNG